MAETTDRIHSAQTPCPPTELRDPKAYPHSVDEVGFLQTHISYLFFAGDRVYKVKKPVDLGFLDFTTLERRRHFCEEEVRLNRRLAPDVYLGVVPISQTHDGHLRVDNDSDIVEWAVEMVRLPAHRMLSSLLERGEVDNELMNSIAGLLAEFHASCPTGPGVDEYGTPGAISKNVEENFVQLREFVDFPGAHAASGVRLMSLAQLGFLRARSRSFLAEHRELLGQRIQAGFIREGHGDLHGENICVTADGPVAYDCIEFNKHFRCSDVISDLAFLTMDLDFRGYPGFSKYLSWRYAKASDTPLVPELERFYKGYRAIVRGKVAAITAADPRMGGACRRDLRRKAMGYLQLAAAYELPPAMVLMCGLPASGKSWLAKSLAGPLRAAVLHSDVRRKALAGLAPKTHAPGEYATGLYAPEQKDKTYRSILADTLRNLRSGHSVIVDATFSLRKYRSLFIDAAVRLGIPYYVVHITAPEELIRARMVLRETDDREVSDADIEVYLREREVFEAPTEVPLGHVLETVSGEGIPEAQSSIVIDRMIQLREDS